ncbi:MAG: NAD-dependent epimerase/dehydratase [Parcubacteria group bacterium GW2011_GWC2_45_7]|nr:MAG: NAD-dependent epimerase/dehydratase [Parcubacteria group bacterium GW2011_GWC2_45_7]KKU74095.1 MAG: NAD-dependent epimerase/dehydratase [Parcubacteria group bacterium GW2011_GWA2_47_26]
MNILVVGGAGYIGGAVTDLLMKTSHTVRVYDALLYEEHYRKPIDFMRADIRDRVKLAKQLQWSDAVIWLAALVADGSCALYPELAVEFNQTSVGWLAEHFDGRIIFPSTCLMYAIKNGVLDEDSAKDPSSIYTKTKFIAEEYLKDKNALIVRLSTVFGVGDSFSRPRLDLVVNLLTARALMEKRMIVFGGEQSRPFVHVRDVAQVMVDNVDTKPTGIFNLHAENMKIIELSKKIQAHIPDATIEIKEAALTDTGDYRMGSEKARSVLGFKPSRTVEDGIKEIQAFILEGRLKDIRNPRYSNEAFLKANPII